jgi:hypothetical protein
VLNYRDKQLKKKDKLILKSFADVRSATSYSIDELQGLLLQISFAIMMIFMIAYFMFRTETKLEQEEQLLEVQRQKLELAVDAVNIEYAARYGFNVFYPEAKEQNVASDDGVMASFASAPAKRLIVNGELTSDPIYKAAFLSSSANANTDFSDVLALREAWLSRVSEVAEISLDQISKENIAWLDESANQNIDSYRKRIRAVQLSCAALLQRYWMQKPQTISDPKVAAILEKYSNANESERMLLLTELSEALSAYSFNVLKKFAGGVEMLK